MMMFCNQTNKIKRVKTARGGVENWFRFQLFLFVVYSILYLSFILSYRYLYNLVIKYLN
jgi:hypothetical protein